MRQASCAEQLMRDHPGCPTLEAVGVAGRLKVLVSYLGQQLGAGAP
jgi:hypothetical protein